MRTPTRFLGLAPTAAAVERLFVSTAEAAAALNVSPAYLRKDRRSATPVVPVTRLGARALYSVEQLRALAARRG